MKILGLQKISGFGRKIEVRVKKICLGEKFGILGILHLHFAFAFCILHFAFCISCQKFRISKKKNQKNVDAAATPKTNGHPLCIHVRVWTENLTYLK